MSELSPHMSNTEIERLRMIGALLSAVRYPDETGVIVSFGAQAPDFDCDEGSLSATVTKGGETATASAAGFDLATAILLARGKVERQIAAREKKGALPSAPAGER